MYTHVIFLTPKKNVLFYHIGVIKNGEELASDETTEKWEGGFENYTLNEHNGTTTLVAEVDFMPDYNTPKGLNVSVSGTYFPLKTWDL